MDEVFRHIREFRDARQRAQAQEIIRWMDGYFDAYTWKLRAIWCFAEANKEPFIKIIRALERERTDRCLREDREIRQAFDDAVRSIGGDYDAFVAMMTTQTPEAIDAMIEQAWD